MISDLVKISKLIELNQGEKSKYAIKMKYKPNEIVGIPLPSKMNSYRFYIDVSHTVADFRSRILDVDIRDVEYLKGVNNSV